MTEGTHNDHQARVLRALIHIQKHLDDDISLDALADVACLSRFHFHRVFTALVGEPVKAHVRRLRLERSAFRLVQTRRPVVDLALEAGYETHEAYTRAFRATFGMTPSDYRRHKKVVTSPVRSGVHYSEVEGGFRYRPITYRGNPMEIRIESWKERKVAFVRHIGPYSNVGKAWERLCSWAGPRGLLGRQPWLAGVSYDDPDTTAPEHLRYDACLAVPEGIEGEANVGLQMLAGGRYVVATHEGALENLNKSYRQLYGKWIPEQGLTLRDAPAIEIYLNDPGSTPPEELRTLICIPIE